MAKKSAYCGLISKGDGLYLYLVPETEGGKKLKFEDVDEYLTHMKINYDKIEVNKLITSLTDRCEYKLSEERLKYPEDEYMTVSLSNDKLHAFAKFYPPADGGHDMTVDDIVQRLSSFKVRFGFDMVEIKRHTMEKDYCIELTLAKAQMPREGKPAKIIYNFNTSSSRRPKINEDGSVDFHNLDNINHIHKGDLLATLEPADDGDNGTDILGGILKPQKVLHKVLKYGQKIVANDDGTQIFSEVDGHVTLVEDRVFVSDSMEIPADVGPSTGDLEYDGNITIKGNVVSGYTIKSHGDVIVEGVVEGAKIYADGQIILKRGIQGGSKGFLQAGGNIVTKFIESAEVISGGYVQTESIMHSKVSARGDVTVGGKKGFITGGEVHAGNSIVCKLAGNEMETKTTLEVGSDPEFVAEYRRLEKNIGEWTTEYEKLTTILTTYAKKLKSGEKFDAKVVLSIRSLRERFNQLAADIPEAKTKFESMSAEMELNSNGCIKISDTIYPGCKVTISNVSSYIKKPTQHGKFIREGADIRIVAL